ncbi:restriction endonuclease subunit S [Burkholderia seminalis]|uniref:restriction endonuclease subunit S n=1 Tax=Burkholderia seminalis TaxID=488731 RepID=UPI00158A78B5|nr:restriction endonuclease subunit S [Burkholderia seminalis]
MANEWTMVAIGEVAEVFDGPHATPKTIEHGPIFLGIGALQNGRIQLGETRHVTPDDFKIWTRRVKPEGGDVVFSYETRLGEAAIIPDGFECCLGRRMALVRADRTRLEPRYFLYQFLSPYFQELIRSRTIPGATVDRIALKEFPSFVIPLPPLEEQRAIAHILGTLDDKIELNRRANETLEAMARALFKAWFVDFEPVRAKMDGRWQRSQSLPGLPAHLYDLFPDRLGESELGENPEGWEVTSVDDEFDVTMGQSPPGNTYNETGDGLPFYQGRADFEFRFPKRRVYCTAPTRLARNGDTLVSVRAPVGDINMASEDCAVGRGVAAVRHKTGSRSYTYQFMSSISDVFARFDAEGTVFGSIGKKDFHSIAHVKPPRDLVFAYEKLACPSDDQIERNERESRTLAQLRDTLLPKLISGELRVLDAERIFGAAI